MAIEETWYRLGEATRLARRTQNQLYRLAALGAVQTRRSPDGRVEFLATDLARLAEHPAGAA